MKKMIALLLSLLMVLSLAACGGNSKKDSKKDDSDSSKTESETPADDQDSEEEETAGGSEGEGETENASADSGASEELMNFLKQLTMIEPTDAIVGTEWGLSGGRIDGVEMEQEDLDQSLELYGGQLNIVFDSEKTISMVQGNGTLKGTYQLMEEGHVMKIVFDNDGSELIYAGVFADVEGTEVLMLFSDDTGNNAVYFTLN